jgi:LPS-assembly protein
VVYPSVSYPLLNDLGYYMTPKLGVHHTRYLMGTNNTSALPDATRTVPIFSIDNGMVFERDTTFAGGSYTQTMEPRLYYVYVPYRDQSLLPVFDSAQAPFNFGQMFTENRFFGSDRIGDANMATLALTSRIIDNEGGTERLRVMLGERFSFKAPKVALPGTSTDSNNRSDILLALGGRVTKTWSLDSLMQYNPIRSRTMAYNVTAHYKPEPGKLLNLGYRYTSEALAFSTGLPSAIRQADISTQWPLFGRWQSVARLSYSFQDKRIVEALAGLEYNQSCWAVRFGAQSFMTSTLQRSTPIFLQLELNDLVPIGSDVMDILRNSVNGYTKMNSLPAERPVQGLR